MSEARKRANTHCSGMESIYRVAAELTCRGFIVSLTSRSAKGADLLATDQGGQTSADLRLRVAPVAR